MTKKHSAIVLFIVVSFIAQSSQADFWSKARDSVKKTIKNPTRIITKPVEESARVIEKTTGGDVSKIAGKIRKETVRTEENMYIGIKGAGQGVKSTFEGNPIDGLSRVAGCVVTVCASEVVAHKKIQKIRARNRIESEKRIKAAEQRSVQELKNELIRRVAVLKKDIEVVDRQMKSAGLALEVSNLITDNVATDKKLPAKFRSLATKKNIDLVKLYVGKISTQLREENLSKAELDQIGSLEQQILSAAKAAQVDYMSFFNAVISAASKDIKIAMDLEVSNQQLNPMLVSLSVQLMDEKIRIQSEISSINTKIAAL